VYQPFIGNVCAFAQAEGVKAAAHVGNAGDGCVSNPCIVIKVKLLESHVCVEMKSILCQILAFLESKAFEMSAFAQYFAKSLVLNVRVGQSESLNSRAHAAHILQALLYATAVVEQDDMQHLRMC
jgi:hypothetical protein